MKANSIDSSATLRLEVLQEKIPHKDFQLIVSRFIKLIDGISEEACTAQEKMSWDISVLRGSLVLEAHARTEMQNYDAVGIIQDAVLNPSGITLKNLEGFRKGLPSMHLLVRGKTEDIFERARRDTKFSPKIQKTEYGTVEGFLDVLDTRGSPQFTISDSIWNVEVKCIVVFPELIELMRKLWQRRILAYGEVCYSQKGLPARINAERVEDYPYSETPISEYRGILSSE